MNEGRRISKQGSLCQPTIELDTKRNYMQPDYAITVPPRYSEVHQSDQSLHDSGVSPKRGTHDQNENCLFSHLSVFICS